MITVLANDVQVTLRAPYNLGNDVWHDIIDSHSAKKRKSYITRTILFAPEVYLRVDIREILEMQSINRASSRVMDNSFERIAFKTFESRSLRLKFTKCLHVYYSCRQIRYNIHQGTIISME